MIEILNKSKNIETSSVSKSYFKDKSSYNKNEKFENILDQSLSDQKELTQEIHQKHQKKIKKLAQKFLELEKKVTNNSDLQSDDAQKVYVSLQQLFLFLENNLDSIAKNSQDNGNINEISDMMTILSDMIDHSLLQLEESGTLNPSMINLIDQTLFVIDNNQDFQQMFVQPAQQKIMTNLMTHLNTELEALSSSESAVIISHDFEILESPEVVDEEIFLKQSTDDFIAEQPFDNNLAQDMTDQSDTSSDSEFQERVLFKDLRTNKQEQNNVVDQIEPLSLSKSLEDIDKEQIIDATSQLEISLETKPSEGSLKSDILSSAQRTYHALSSAISRVQVEALMQSVSGKAIMIMHDGGNELRLKLTPPELGQMKLSFVTEDGIMSGKVVVETSEAKMFFEQNIDNLRESLANEGIRLADVSVELGNHHDFDSEENQELSQSYQAIRTTQGVISEPIMSINKLQDSLVDFIA
ncbi:MAG: flagellar hook-length control protein FliK [Brevinema sp.]